MDEGDLRARTAPAAARVDQLGARRGEPGERGADVVDLVGDVVHPRPALGEEPPDRRVVAVAASSSIRLSPTRSDAASTPCSGTSVAVLDLGAEQPP